MLLILETMGCGRSKQQSPKNGEQDVGVNGTKEKGTGKKKKQKGEKKENKDPQKGKEKFQVESKLSPTKSSANSLKLPPCSINGSQQQQLQQQQQHQQQQILTIDVEFSKSKGDKSIAKPKQTNIKVTNSQLEFFKMLDEKIEKGYDYSSSDYKSEDGISLATP